MDLPEAERRHQRVVEMCYRSNVADAKVNVVVTASGIRIQMRTPQPPNSSLATPRGMCTMVVRDWESSSPSPSLTIAAFSTNIIFDSTFRLKQAIACNLPSLYTSYGNLSNSFRG